MNKLRRCLLALATLLFVAGCATEKPDPELKKVLMIGNSFSISLMSNLPQVAKSLGVKLDLTSLYIGGCSLERHIANFDHVVDRKDRKTWFAPYTVHQAVCGEMQPYTKGNVAEFLKGEKKYDIITIQQASHFSIDADSFHPYGDRLVEAIRQYQPQARIFVQETWSYTPWDDRLAKWGIDQNEMYARLSKAYSGFAEQHGLPLIRMGTAVQRWRERLPVRYTDHSFGGDVVGGRWQKPEDQFNRKFDNTWEVNSDVFHLNEKGEYLQALVWMDRLFDRDVSQCEFVPDCVTPDEDALMKSIVRGLR